MKGQHACMKGQHVETPASLSHTCQDFITLGAAQKLLMCRTSHIDQVSVTAW